MKIVIMGLGLYPNGSGISAAKFFIGLGDDVLITDLKTKKELAHQIRELEKFCKLKKKLLPKYSLGGHKAGDFSGVDIVMRNPGVPQDSKFLKIARKSGAKIETDISIFLKGTRAIVIGITGTRGKSTTASLIYEILKADKRQVWLGGNIKISPLSFIGRVKKDDIVVLELSSWMLENFDEYKLAPHIAIVTNIYPDHLNIHKNMAEYISAKKNIFKHQKAGDYLVLNGENAKTKKWTPLRQGSEGQEGPSIYYFSKKDAPKCKIQLCGKHNLENVAAAIAVAKIMKVLPAKIKKVLKEFKGLPDRQELVAEKKGIKYINDTTATTADGAIAALRTFGAKQKNIILIAGGKDKGLDYKNFVKEIKKYCKAVILLPGSATDKIKKLLLTTHYSLLTAKDMKSAVKLAKEQAVKGDIILLSPAAASFGLFKNEFDRGEQFKKEIKKK